MQLSELKFLVVRKQSPSKLIGTFLELQCNFQIKLKIHYLRKSTGVPIVANLTKRSKCKWQSIENKKVYL